MKVLWIVNATLNELSRALFNKPSNGLWMDALLSDFRGRKDYEIVVATTLPRRDSYRLQTENITYYALPDDYPLLYNENKPENIRAWQELIETEKPDLIQVWGTEFTHGLCALRAAKGIPSVIYMQGLLQSIAENYRSGISERDLKKTRTLRDFLRKDGILQQQAKFFAGAKKEAEMLRLSGAIISENEWCNSAVRAIVPDIRVYDCPLSINKVFSQYRWNAETVERHSIICTASGYILKGLHVLLEAVAKLKPKYPDIKLYVPGKKMVAEKGLRAWLRKDGYTNYIERMIRERNLADHIVWLGNLPQQELAAEYAKRQVFVMPSAIENHSSSLKEAMIVGMPCVASAVGGIPEYVRDGESGFLYPFEDRSALADKIATIFEDDALATRFGNAAREDMLKLHGGEHLLERVTEIYQSMTGEKK